MESMMKTLQSLLDDRFDKAMQEFRRENAVLDAAVKEKCAIGEQLTQCLNTSEAQLFDRYASAAYDVEDLFQKHLYLQGAKDCVSILRELGVIK